MVKLNNAMKNEKSVFMGMNRAKDLFMEVATSQELGDENDEPAIIFQDFIKLMIIILAESNTEAKKKNKPIIPVPSLKDLQVLFNKADADHSGSVDEYEFLGLYQQVMDGNVKGMGGNGFNFYIRPHQLMQFGQHEHHPDTDWQDLFFDLLFVGGAFQTGNFLKAALIAGDEHVMEGVLWSFAIFLSLAQQWFMKMLLSARFGYSSMFHYLLDNVEFILLAYAMWHIPSEDVIIERGSDDGSGYSSYSSYSSSYSSYSAYSAYSSRRQLGGSYSAGSGNYDTYTPVQQMQQNIYGRCFGFTLCIALNNLLYIFKWMEIITDPNASPGAVTISRHQAGAYMGVCFITCIAARLAHHGTSDKEGVGKYVMYLWMFGNVAYIGSFYYWVMFLHGRKQQGRLATSGVPMNVSYVIHRVGEFCMLMIGETVLSLLVVMMEKTTKSYLMFGTGMLIACNLHFHHFSTYPPDPSKHVLHKGTFDYRSLFYICIMIYLYPFCLTLIGVCLKVLLKKADYGIVFEDTNWALAIGICFEYAFINFFVYIHDKSLGQARWKPFKDQESILKFFKALILKGATCISVLILASFELRPYPMLMWSGLVICVQSIIILYCSPVDDDEDKDAIAQMDFEYSQARASQESLGDSMKSRRSVSLDRAITADVSLDGGNSGSGSYDTKEEPGGTMMGDRTHSNKSNKSSIKSSKQSSLKNSIKSKQAEQDSNDDHLLGSPIVQSEPSTSTSSSSSSSIESHSEVSIVPPKSLTPNSSNSSSIKNKSNSSNNNKTKSPTSVKKIFRSESNYSKSDVKSDDGKKTIELLKELGLLTTAELHKIESRLVKKEKSIALI